MNLASIAQLKNAPPSPSPARAWWRSARRWTLAGLLIGLTAYISCYWPADTSFLSYSLAGAFVIHLWSRPRFAEIAATFAAATACLGLYLACQGAPALYVPTPGFFLGLGSLGVLGTRALRERELPAVALPALLLPTTLVVTVLARPIWTTADPVWDWTMLAFDEHLGGQSSFILGRYFIRHPWITTIHREIYDLLPLGMAFLYAVHMQATKAVERQRVIVLLLTTPLLCLLVYRLLPVVGPKFAFPAFYPERIPTFPPQPYPLISLDSEILRNGLPSMHFGWALLIWWGLYRRSIVWAGVSGAFLLLTVLATLGLGQHYLVDLIVAVPFVGMMQAALAVDQPWRGPRLILVSGGLLATVVWVWLLRQPETWGSDAVLVLFSVLSVVVPLWLAWRLPSAE